MKAFISEIFCSYQGEGFYIGEKQIFVRFSGCNLSCDYCDEPAAKRNGFILTVPKLVKEIKIMSKKFKTKRISFTGGEPLLQAEIIREVCQKLRKHNFSFRLETNGTLFGNLKKILRFISHISADIKLPCDIKSFKWKEHSRFLRIAGKKAAVKVVVRKKTPLREFNKAVNLVFKHSKDAVFFIQPESGEFFANKKMDFCPYERFVAAASLKLKNVRLLPQMHKIWQVK